MFFEVWYQIISFLKRFFFKNKEESNIFSHKFNVTKWTLFISFTSILAFNCFLIYKLFVISAYYIDLKDQVKQNNVIFKSKKNDYNRYIKKLENDNKLINNQTQILSTIKTILNKPHITNKQILTIVKIIQLVINKNQNEMNNLIVSNKAINNTLILMEKQDEKRDSTVH